MPAVYVGFTRAVVARGEVASHVRGVGGEIQSQNQLINPTCSVLTRPRLRTVPSSTERSWVSWVRRLFFFRFRGSRRCACGSREPRSFRSRTGTYQQALPYGYFRPPVTSGASAAARGAWVMRRPSDRWVVLHPSPPSSATTQLRSGRPHPCRGCGAKRWWVRMPAPP